MVTQQKKPYQTLVLQNGLNLQCLSKMNACVAAFPQFLRWAWQLSTLLLLIFIKSFLKDWTPNWIVLDIQFLVISSGWNQIIKLKSKQGIWPCVFVYVGVCTCLSSPSVYIASDTEIGTYEARSIDCLKVCCLGLEQIDQVEERARNSEPGTVKWENNPEGQ